MLITVLVLCLCYSSAVSLSCQCGITPCKTPLCCESGQYSLEACGCCLTCAKTEGQKCGGHFGVSGNGASGTCASGYRCLRQCECKTVQKKSCVFPFSVQGETYNACTDAGLSDNGAVWCATQVDANGEVDVDSRQDCENGCPGTDNECNAESLSHVDGVCIPGTSAFSLLGKLQTGPLTAIVDSVALETKHKVAPFCQDEQTASQPNKTSSSSSAVSFSCHCGQLSEKTKNENGLIGNPWGGCVTPPVAKGTPNLANSWCFLKNVEDPKNPRKNCYGDIQYSEVDEKFWSSYACGAGLLLNKDSAIGCHETCAVLKNPIYKLAKSECDELCDAPINLLYGPKNFACHESCNVLTNSVYEGPKSECHAVCNEYRRCHELCIVLSRPVNESKRHDRGPEGNRN